MFCPKCSAENSYDANFCSGCAFPLSANFDTVSNARQVENLDEQETQIKVERVERDKDKKVERGNKPGNNYQVSSLNIIRLLLAAALIVALVVFGNYVFGEYKRFSEYKPAPQPRLF